ncbi:solute carrier family 22 member 3-like [Acipenser ruthenus]|uniref:solute carrier family 22 member 3-like n=1 Tax=Acipenser ruthenus TaxID=7906 RepID=UPI0027426073|nr:solute carrier family 22 member 3-like [Acipenser ruthenus]
MPTFDELLVDIGEFGSYQKRVFLLTCVPGILFSFVFVGIVFLGDTPAHWCRSPAVDEIREKCGWTWEEERNFTVPQLKGAEGSFSQCEQYDIHWNSTDLSCSKPLSQSTNYSTDGIHLTPCKNGWNFDTSRTTIVSEYDLVCEHAWKVDLTQAFLNVGLLIGAVVIGYGADRFGRKLCILISVFGLGVSGVAMAFSPNYIMLLLFRTIQGVFGKGAWMASFVLVTEIVGSSHRRVVSIVAQIFFTFGVVILPGIAYLIPSWKALQLTITLPTFILLIYFWLIPESPRWLLNRQKIKEALKIAADIAKHNGRSLPEKYREMKLLEPNPEDLSNPSFLDLFRTSQMRKQTLILMYAWFTNAVVYQGLIMRVGIVGGNLHLGFFISGIVELPAAFIILLTIDRVGRRLPFATANIVAGVACLITALIPEDINWLKTTFAVIGRLGITMAYEIVYLVNSELYPTSLRNLGVSACSSLDDVGGILAPFLLYRLASVWLELPLILYGVIALLCGGLVMLLPETNGIDLPETVQDVETLGRGHKVQVKRNKSKTRDSCI